jgi:hypothetical protein
MSTPYCLKECTSSSFLPRTPSVGESRALPRYILERPAIFGNEHNGRQDRQWAGCSFGEGGDRREEPTSQLHICLEWNALEEIQNLLEWVGGSLSGDVVGLETAEWTLKATYFFDF